MSHNQHGSTSTTPSTVLPGSEPAIMLGLIRMADEIDPTDSAGQNMRKLIKIKVAQIQTESEGIANQLPLASVEDLKTLVAKTSTAFIAIQKSLQETSLAGEADIQFKLEMIKRLALEVMLPTTLLGGYKEYHQVDEQTRKTFYQSVVRQSHNLQNGLIASFMEEVKHAYPKRTD